MQQYSINLAGRIKNFPLPKNQPLIPLFEAIVNSLNAIEERRREDGRFTAGYIEVEVLRSNDISLFDKTEVASINGFIIKDNGIGFTENNMKSFLESDSTYKAEIGGKGVGRFSWLKALASAKISSIYNEKGIFLKREFKFSLDNSYRI